MNIPRTLFAKLEERLQQWARLGELFPAREPLDLPISDDLPNLPFRVVFRCAVCAARAGRMKPGGDFSLSDLECSGDHGKLRDDLTMAELQQEWTRRGEPDQLNMYLSPIQ